MPRYCSNLPISPTTGHLQGWILPHSRGWEHHLHLTMIQLRGWSTTSRKFISAPPDPTSQCPPSPKRRIYKKLYPYQNGLTNSTTIQGKTVLENNQRYPRKPHHQAPSQPGQLAIPTSPDLPLSLSFTPPPQKV